MVISDTLGTAMITGVGPILVIIVTAWVNRTKTDKKLQEIHVLVNSRLSAALDEITSLRGVVSRQADVSQETTNRAVIEADTQAGNSVKAVAATIPPLKDREADRLSTSRLAAQKFLDDTKPLGGY